MSCLHSRRGLVVDSLLWGTVVILLTFYLYCLRANATVEDAIESLHTEIALQAKALRTRPAAPITVPPSRRPPPVHRPEEMDDAIASRVSPSLAKRMARFAALNRNPEYAEFSREASHRFIQQRFSGLIAQLQLDPGREIELRRLLNERQDSLTDTRELLEFPNSPGLRSAEPYDRFTSMAIAREFNQQEAILREFLGDEGFALYREHEITERGRPQAERFDAFLQISNLPALTAEQQTRVALTLATESQDRLARIVADPLSRNSAPKPDEYFRQHLAGTLSDAQLAAYTDYQAHQHELERLTTRARAKLGPR